MNPENEHKEELTAAQEETAEETAGLTQAAAEESVEEVEEELQQQAEQQYHCALDYIACFFSEKHIREKVVHSFVREPDVCYCNQCRGNTH